MRSSWLLGDSSPSRPIYTFQASSHRLRFPPKDANHRRLRLAMPRPKVLPSQRQRAPEACNSCREAKKRCSGTPPCTHCLRRGIGDSCFISNQPRGRRRSSTAATITSPSPRVGPGSGTTRATVTSLTRSVLQTPAPLGPAGHSPSLSINVAPASETTEFRPLSPSDSRTTDLGASSISRSVVEQPPHRPEPSGDMLLSAKPSSRMLLNLRGERGTHNTHSRLRLGDFSD